MSRLIPKLCHICFTYVPPFCLFFLVQFVLFGLSQCFPVFSFAILSCLVVFIPSPVWSSAVFFPVLQSAFFSSVVVYIFSHVWSSRVFFPVLPSAVFPVLPSAKGSVVETGLQPLGAPGSVMAGRKYSAETTRRRLLLLSVHRVKFWKLCTVRADLRKNAEIRENIVETANF